MDALADQILTKMSRIEELLENQLEELLTVKEVAEVSKLCERTIYEIASEPDCPVVKVGRKILIKKMAFLRYLGERIV